MTVGWEKIRLVSLNAVPKGWSTLLANAAIETPPVLPADVIRPVIIAFECVQ